ncbi:MAG: T9SS type A sorting domain-containing protein [Ignavibacteriaceae bacterium]|nr:T9SS type A sorting domain-containing protein [Ignavibacteriaceae bacterium]
MNLDGGGSSQMAVGTTLINRPEGGTAQRAIPTMLAVTIADSLPLLPPVYYNKVIDTGDSLCTLTGTGWTTSGISGFWGGTPSLICTTGNGEQYARFRIRVPSPGQYRVDAWWVAASNRANNTPFIVKYAGGVDTVRLDQSVNGLKWNSIGTFNFTGTDADEIYISNFAQTGQSICADAIRILSFDSLLTSAEKEEAGNINFELYNNYPNPFNPETTISYRLVTPEIVTLSVFDLLGREIKLVDNELKEAGYHRVEFNSSLYDLSSGIYLYRLSAGKSFLVGKMICMK